MNVLHTRWRALVLALLLAVSLAVPAAAAETETAAEDLQTLADTAASYAAQYGGAQSLQARRSVRAVRGLAATASADGRDSMGGLDMARRGCLGQDEQQAAAGALPPAM